MLAIFVAIISSLMFGPIIGIALGVLFYILFDDTTPPKW